MQEEGLGVEVEGLADDERERAIRGREQRAEDGQERDSDHHAQADGAQLSHARGAWQLGPADVGEEQGQAADDGHARGPEHREGIGGDAAQLQANGLQAESAEREHENQAEQVEEVERGGVAAHERHRAEEGGDREPRGVGRHGQAPRSHDPGGASDERDSAQGDVEPPRH